MATSVAEVIEVEYEGIMWTADKDIKVYKKLTNTSEKVRFIATLLDERDNLILVLNRAYLELHELQVDNWNFQKLTVKEAGIESNYSLNLKITENLAHERDGLLEELTDVVSRITTLKKKNVGNPVVWSSFVEYDGKTYHTVPMSLIEEGGDASWLKIADDDSKAEKFTEILLQRDGILKAVNAANTRRYELRLALHILANTVKAPNPIQAGVTANALKRDNMTQTFKNLNRLVQEVIHLFAVLQFTIRPSRYWKRKQNRVRKQVPLRV